MKQFGAMSDETDTKRRHALDTIDNGPLVSGGKSDRRSILKGTLAAAGAVLGLPTLGSGVRAASDGEIIEYYSQPEQIDESIESSPELIGFLDDVGFFDGSGQSLGLQVSSVTRDGEKLPEQRLALEYEFGTLTIVLSPDGVPLGGYAQVVTTEERMQEAPFEWPLDKMGELPDGRYLVRTGPDGWTEVRQDGGFLGNSTETWCGKDLVECRPSTGECWRIGCCGHVERTCCCDDDDDSSSSYFNPCFSTDPCVQSCWEDTSGECRCTYELPCN